MIAKLEVLDVIKAPDLEKREPDIILLAGYCPPDKKLEPSTGCRIEPGGIAQLRFQGRRIGVRIMKAGGNEFVGRISDLDSPSNGSEGLSLEGFIKFHEENIFGYDPPTRELVFRKSISYQM